jgi:hypothetical protein
MIELASHVEAGLLDAANLQRAGDMDGARAKYLALLDDADTDDAGAAYVLHMLAVIVDDPKTKLDLNLDSLARAESAGPDTFPLAMQASLFANVGYSHLALGERDEARRWYVRAQQAAEQLPDDDYGKMIRENAQRAIEKLEPA